MKIFLFICILVCGNRSESVFFRKWSLSNNNGSIRISNLSSPIDVYSALYKNSIIEWPLKGFNDIKYRWIAYDNWTFTSDPFPIEKFELFNLHVSGLDVQPLIFINNRFVGTTESEFVSQDISIDSSIFSKFNNVLKLKFYSPILLANISSKISKYQVPPDCWPDEFHGECHINFIRKTQASFGWDWGPAIPTVGIRGQIELYKINKNLAKIRTVKIITKTDGNCSVWSANVEMSIFVLAVDLKSELCAHIHLPNLYITSSKCTSNYRNGIVRFTLNLPLDLNHLKLWWPYDMGTPALYELKSSIIYSNQILDRKSQYIGFRHTSINQTVLPNNAGRYFGFYVNCRPFFLKGTNWVPRTYLTIDWNNESYVEYLLNSVKTANLNSIRLWGGGKPEIEHFYSVADKLGLMIWHDLMFACALYPDDKDFLFAVRKEVSEIVSNLQNHPCILVWSGNNEIEVLIAQGWYNSTRMDANNINRYYDLFGKVIKEIVTMEDPFTPYIMSSPSNGVESEKTKGVSENPQSPFYGDCHFYLYDGDLWNESSYPITRMTTEFGFQSFPNLETWAQQISSDLDFEINSTLMNHLQHHPDGNKQLMNSIKKYFGKIYPRHTVKNSERYEWFSYLSQINQALILRVYINKLRSNQCILSSDGKGLTQGAMYWQLNDNWIAPTWSTIDYLGQWKLAHYYIKNSFSSERIAMAVINNLITGTLILPNNIDTSKYEIEITCRDIHQITSLSLTGKIRFSFKTENRACNVHLVFSRTIEEFLKTLNCPDIRQCLFSINLWKETKIVAYDPITLVYPQNMDVLPEMAKDQIKYEVLQNKLDYSTCSIILTNKYIHLYASLTTSTLGSFSNNGMHITDNITTIQFFPRYYKDNEFFNCSLLVIKAHSLNELYV